MKKTLFLLAVLAFIPTIVDAQALKVRSDGNVEAFTPDMSNSGEDGNLKLILRSSRKASLSVQRMGSAYFLYDGSTFGIYSGNTPLSGKYNYAISANGSSSTVLNSGRSYGVIGAAGSTSSGYNYGISGHMYGTQYGAGVYGGLDFPQYIPGRYAGYFSGNVGVTGTVTATNFITSSDIRYKQNIVELNKKGGILQSVLTLNPVEYNLKQAYLTPPVAGDTAAVAQKMLTEDSQHFKKKHFGLIAQEVQKLYPDLVYEDGSGYLSVNYTGLIPLLIEAIKEQQAQIDELKNKESVLRSETAGTGIENVVAAVNKLYQNTPNPFSINTEIRYCLAENILKANLYIYDMQGKQIKNIPNLAKGDNSVTINGSELSAGMYIYTLIADGQEVATKRMILTE